MSYLSHVDLDFSDNDGFGVDPIDELELGRESDDIKISWLDYEGVEDLDGSWIDLDEFDTLSME